MDGSNSCCGSGGCSREELEQTRYALKLEQHGRALVTQHLDNARDQYIRLVGENTRITVRHDAMQRRLRERVATTVVRTVAEEGEAVSCCLDCGETAADAASIKHGLSIAGGACSAWLDLLALGEAECDE